MGYSLCLELASKVRQALDTVNIASALAWIFLNWKRMGAVPVIRNKNMICCMTVAPEYRRHGIGSAVLEIALNELDRGVDISVSALCENDEKGIALSWILVYIPPRRVYFCIYKIASYSKFQ